MSAVQNDSYQPSAKISRGSIGAQIAAVFISIGALGCFFASDAIALRTRFNVRTIQAISGGSFLASVAALIGLRTFCSGKSRGFKEFMIGSQELVGPLVEVGDRTSIRCEKPEQFKMLKREYYYRSISADGNCFYTAVAAGLLHQYCSDPSQIEDMIISIDNENSAATLALKKLQSQPTKETLEEILNSRSQLEAFTTHLRTVATCKQLENDHETDIKDLQLGVFADISASLEALKELGLVKNICNYILNAGHPFDQMHDSIDPLPSVLIIYYRTWLHCELLLKKDFIDSIR